MVADIVHGELGAADWMFLIGAVLFALAAVTTWKPARSAEIPVWPWAACLAYAGACAVAVGLLLL